MTEKRDLAKIVAERMNRQKSIRANTTDRLRKADRRVLEDRDPESFLYARDLKDKVHSELASCP